MDDVDHLADRLRELRPELNYLTRLAELRVEELAILVEELAILAELRALRPGGPPGSIVGVGADHHAMLHPWRG